ncbi:hypothetical protein ACFWYW_35015 [Nonomuraea sp. NPDC059023]|uniref:hypothetical protein n=1 Tax=unclassified Nonomuraea TaxID=2593643 RepID=UPI0036CAD84A
MHRCPRCGCFEYGGAPSCARCRGLLDTLVEDGYQAFLKEESLPDDPDLAEMIVSEIKPYAWRVVDAAFDRLTCPACGSRRGRGPAGCPPCDLDEGFRYSAREPDRPGVPPLNEHAVRVGAAVLRNAHRHSEKALLSWRLGFPLVLAGGMFTTAQAQNLRARINKGAGYDDLAPWVATRIHPPVVNEGESPSRQR